MKNSENLSKTQCMGGAVQVLLRVLGHRHHTVTFGTSMLRLIPPHCEAGGHPGPLYASDTVTKFQRPHSNTKVGPYKGRGQLFCLYPILSKEAFPGKLCHHLHFASAHHAAGTHSEISTTFHLVKVSNLLTVTFHPGTTQEKWKLLYPA